MKTFLCVFFFYFLVNGQEDYADEFAIEFDQENYDDILDFKAYDLEVVRQISSLGNVYHLKRTQTSSNVNSAFDSIGELFEKHPSVRRIEQQVDLDIEQKADFKVLFDELPHNKEAAIMLSDELYNYKQKVANTLLNIEKKDGNGLDIDYTVQKLDMMDYIDQNSAKKSYDSEILEMEYELTDDDRLYLKLVDERQERVKNIHFNDPKADLLWQYNNHGQFHRMNPGLDMNIYPAYLANYTGQGVVVTVIDDGLDTRHIEIAQNYDPAASIDFNNPHTYVSSPRGPTDRNVIPADEGHGTLCASVIGGVANNNFCAHGVAFNVNLGGIRMLAKRMVTDLLEAYALTHNNQYISIYSNSWGPKDSGAKTAPVTFYVSKAFETGADKGRNGRGSIFIFASGNGGMKYDHCGADGLVNSPFTFAVTAVNIHGRKPAYTEECTAISVTAAVGGYGYKDIFYQDEVDPSLVASQINGKCHKKFLGTSAAVPLISGCIALALEANPELSWRDIQHLMWISARIPNPKDIVWQLNTAGILVSDHYGAGLLDCSAFVKNALKWKTVGPRRSCVAGQTDEFFDLIIRRKQRTRLEFDTTACGNTNKSIYFLEHVLVHSTIKHICRGDLTLVLSSPTGTRSFLLKNRKWDNNNKMVSFSFLSLMHWGEKPEGVWKLDIIDSGLCEISDEYKNGEETGRIFNASLEFFGTQKSDSASYKNNNLISEYLSEIKVEIPQKSIILNARQVYDIFNEQRKYFIKVTVPDRKKDYSEEPNDSGDSELYSHGS